MVQTTKENDTLERKEFDEVLKHKIASDGFVKPQDRGFRRGLGRPTELTSDVSEIRRVLEVSEKPIVNVKHPGDNEFIAENIDQISTSEEYASQFYTGLATEIEENCGEGSVVHLFETQEVSNDLKTSDEVDAGAEKYTLWMYANGQPLAVEGLIDEDEKPEVEGTDSDWEIDHYLEEGFYLNKEEIIEANAPRGEELIQVREGEPDPENVQELEEAWKGYKSPLNYQDYRETKRNGRAGDVVPEKAYAGAYEMVKDLEYNAEDVREFADSHVDEVKRKDNEWRLSFMVSAMMNSSEDEVYWLPGFEGLGYNSEGNHIFLDGTATWAGHGMESGTISARNGSNISGNAGNVDWSSEYDDGVEIESRGVLETMKKTKTYGED
nr:MAG: hypothetical protein J07AB56_05290 [Candidatus Nanosalinarum sp. J07AB56]